MLHRGSLLYHLSIKHKTIVLKLLTILIGLAVTFASCTHVYYAPNTANAPLFTEKGETRINGLVAEGGESQFSGGELQVAHAITNSFGVMVNGMSVSRSEQVDRFSWGGSYPTHIESGKGSYVEFAGGYFKGLDKSKRVVFETYGGIGFGGVNNDYGYGNYSKVNITKLLIQPSLGYKSKYFETAIVPKLSFVNWHVKESRFSGSNHEQALTSIESKPNLVAFEPALVLRAGAKDVKFQLSFSTSALVGSGRDKVNGLTEDLNVSFGMSVNLRPKTK